MIPRPSRTRENFSLRFQLIFFIFFVHRILTRTTQPAHAASMLLVLIVSCFLYPELQNPNKNRQTSNLTSFLYLASLATHFGAQIWMTFISGLALYFSLPRHTFGMCQEVLFPKYFLLNTALSTLTLITFAKINSNSRSAIQLIVLSVCVTIEAIIYFYLTPPLLELMRAKYQFEQRLGNGQEIGYQQSVDGLRCPHYQQIHRRFRKLHIKCAVGNVVAICCSCFHLHYLASKITVL